MDLSLGFEGKFSSGKVCRLKKSLYGHGLRDLLSLCSNLAITKSKEIIPFSSSNHPENKITTLIVYVEDIIITRDDVEEIQNLKGKLAKEFEIKDLGNLRYFLGNEVARSKRGIYVTQRKYILDLLIETRMLGCKPTGTPIDQNLDVLLWAAT